MKETKNSIVRRLVSERKYKEALSICKDWDKGISNEDREALRLGYECILYPEFYKQIGVDINESIENSILILNKLYNK